MRVQRLVTDGLRPARVLILSLAFLFVSACGGGGGGGGGTTPPPPPPPTGTKITGTVLAPGGALAKLEQRSLFQRMLAAIVPSATAQSNSLAPVSGANVLVFTINDAGQPTSGAIVSGTTGSDGSFSVTLPSGTSLASNLIIQASGTTTPQPVGPANQNTQSCPVMKPSLPPITPAAEFATRALISEIQAKASTLGNFTVDEVNAIIQQAINALASDPNLIGTSIEETITNLVNADDSQIRQLIDDTSTPGEGSAPSGLGGTYNLIGFQANTDSFREARSQEVGTVTIDTSAKTFSVNTTENQVELNETCNASAPCDRSFVRSFNSSNDPISGSITVLSGNLIAFQPSNNEGGALGSFNAAGDVIVVTTEDELFIAIKQTSAAPAVDGNFQGVELDSSLNSDFTVAPDTAYTLGNSRTETDNVSISGGSLTGTSNSNDMFKTITCSGAGACPDSETLGAQTGSDSFSAGITVSDTGVLTVTPPSPEPAFTGAVSSDGNFFTLAAGDPSNGDADIVLGVRQGSNMDNTFAKGTYNFAGLDFRLDSQSTSVSSQGGTITLDGNGNGSGNIAELQSQVTTSCSSGSCPNESQNRTSSNDSPSFTYSVSPTGAVSVTGQNVDGTIQGFASPDGNIIVLTQQKDGTIGQQNSNESGRSLFVLIK